MLNTHYFTSNAHDGLFNRIKLETENIGYYNLPEQNLDEIIVDRQNAFSIGQLIYYFELLTSLVGDLLNINTYNQPGVESSKKILINKLMSQK
jgi:glucose-6-phosphate isomerase